MDRQKSKSTGRERLQACLRWSERVLWTTALVLLAFLAFAFLQARIYQNRAERYLESLRNAPRPAISEAAPTPAPTPAPVEGDILGRIEVPRLRITAPILEGTSNRTLRLGVGHIEDTALPGMHGNSALAGHRDTFFRALQGIRVDDEIQITTPGTESRYQVEWMKVVNPDDLSVLEPSSDSGITLVTCYPFKFIGHAPRRFVVHARALRETQEKAAANLRE
ncbi:MAG: class D sortase [Acidobacteriia bacterium]|nr:class D sortase [Terriglobia bacterium]